MSIRVRFWAVSICAAALVVLAVPGVAMASVSSQRLAGDGALDTGKAIVSAGWGTGSSDTVVIATDGGYWDALSACGRAGLSGAPVVLTNGGSLSAQAADQIRSVGATRAVIIGGNGAITAKVESQVASLVGGSSHVTRLAGNTAADTSRAVYEGGSGWGATCVIATSDGFQDALAAAPYSYAKHAPMFLAESGSTNAHVLSAQTLADIKSGGFTQVIIVGGKYAVSENVESQLYDAGIYSFVRLAGDTAYETCQLVNTWGLEHGMTVSQVGFATGEMYYDALCGAALCGKHNSVLVLGSNRDTTAVTGIVRRNETDISKAYVFGGRGVVTDGMVNSLNEDADNPIYEYSMYFECNDCGAACESVANWCKHSSASTHREADGSVTQCSSYSTHTVSYCVSN